MKIYIEDFRFSCIIGILDFERETPQDVVINLELEYEFRSDFINYADIAELVRSAMQEKKFKLLEDALHHLFSLLKEKYPDISTLFMKITKPSILQECVVSVSDFRSYS
ncbi:dihydroneopterin aldolase [Sulfurimonas sp. HSL-1716]|uniref:dihydroneopterin aldolase n=1 Tax=Hydrocurvibacter sulfurireducens TaxID=3131937 RepID=UPI0031F75BCE